jgi:hypothetical protein
VLEALPQLSVAEGASVLFGWRSNLSPSDTTLILDDWLTRVEAQPDYSALVDWLHLGMHGTDGAPGWLGERPYRILRLRLQYPKLANQAYDWAQVALRLLPQFASDVASLVLDLVESGSITMIDSSYEAEVLAKAAAANPEVVWSGIGQRLSAGSWRVEMAIRGWLSRAIPVQVFEHWIGDSLERARQVAAIADVGDDEPTDLVRYLLTRFGDDDRIGSSLAGEFLSVSWIGPESAMLAQKIARLSTWRKRRTEPQELRSWAKTTAEDLERMRRAALEREAEGDF